MTGYRANYYVADVGKVRRSFGIRARSRPPSKQIFSDFSRVVSPRADLAGAVTGRFIHRSIAHPRRIFPLAEVLLERGDRLAKSFRKKNFYNIFK